MFQQRMNGIGFLMWQKSVNILTLFNGIFPVSICYIIEIYFQVYNKLTEKFKVILKLKFERNGVGKGFTISVFYP